MSDENLGPGSGHARVDDGGFIDPGDAAAASGAGPEPASRGRGPGRKFAGSGATEGGKAAAGTGKAQKTAPLDLTSLTGLFVGLHIALARAADMPELAIDEASAKGYLLAAQNVLRHYNVAATQKTLDWGAFMAATVGLYGPRIAAGMARRAAGGRPSANVHPLRPDGKAWQE